jgi:DNA polymerase I-like protein with 3'-5' exonuclease and polymerase domains
MAATQGAFYNAVDVDVTIRIYLKVRDELQKVGRWHIFERHVLQLDKRLEKMAAAGMPFNHERRALAVTKVEAALKAAHDDLERMIPEALRNFHPKEGYKKTPKDLTGCVMRKFDDDLLGPVERYVRLDDLKISPQLVLRYQAHQKHRIQYKHVKGKGKRPTTDEHALRHLALLYPEDPFYLQLVTMRKLKQLRGTFLGKHEDGTIVGGIQVGADHRVHTSWNHNPSTLRMASSQPNMQNLPRPTDEWSKLVKDCFVTPEGFSFEARDYSGIEAVLVGYFAKSKAYTKVALYDVHTYATAWWLYDSQNALDYNDLPRIEMSDADLIACLAALKKRFKKERQGIKPQVHAINYMAKPGKVQEILFDELGWTIPLKEIRRFFSFYNDLFPEIGQFHRRILAALEGLEGEELHNLRTGMNWIQNPFDYLHMFHQVIRWQKIGGVWQHEPGPGANELAAFPAQSTAAAIAKEAILGFEAEYPHLADGLRLFIHDELLGEWKIEEREEVHAALKDIMERPITQLPLPPEWMMGEYLHINTEGKTGPVWGEMRDRT